MKVYKILFFVSLTLIISLGLIESNAFIKRSRINWDAKNQINLDDFHGLPNYIVLLIHGYDAAIYSFFDYKTINENDTVIIKAFMSNHKSWFAKNVVNISSLLQHEQYHFNITELVARNFRKEVSELSTKNWDKKTLKKLYKRNLGYLRMIQDSYDRETNHSSISLQQRKWERIVDTMLYIFKDYSDTIVNINNKVKYKNPISLIPKLTNLLNFYDDRIYKNILYKLYLKMRIIMKTSVV